MARLGIHSLSRSIALAGVSAAALAGASATLARPLATQAATPPASAIGQEDVQGISASPAFATSGLAVATAAPLSGCKQPCTQLWVTRDGGASWQRAAAAGWAGGRPVVGVDGRGQEVLFASGSPAQRSDDLGATWHAVGQPASGVTVAPSYPSDGTVAAAGPSDYLLRGSGAAQPVTGSGGALSDMSFMYAPGYPSTGSRPPAFLGAVDTHSKASVVEHCSAALACSGPVTLAGTSAFSGPPVLVASGAYATDGVVFAQTAQGIFKSTDAGATFVPLPIVPNDGATASSTPGFGLAPGYREAGPRTAFAAVIQAFNADPQHPHTAGGIFRSDDGGATWRQLHTGTAIDQGASALTVTPDGRMFGGYLESSSQGVGAGLVCSADGGATWGATCPAITRGAAGSAAATRPGTSAPAGHPASGGCSANCTTTGAAAGAAGSAGGSASGAAAAPQSGATSGGGDVAPARPATVPAASGGHSVGAIAGVVLAALAILIAGTVWLRRRRSPGL